MITREIPEKKLRSNKHGYKRKEDNRIHYMDNLRAYAMLLGIVFHAALAYSPLSHNIWLSADTQQFAIIDFIAWCVHLFRMPLFFLIAGYFAFYLIEKRSIKGMIRNRAKRILLPFVLFLPLLMATMFLVLGQAAQMVEHPGPMLQSITQIIDQPDTAQGPIRTMHLWFLYVLLYMYALAVLFFQTNSVDAINHWMNENLLLFLVVAPLLVALSLVTTVKPHPSPETLSPELWSLGFYGFFFLLGCCIFRNNVFIEKLEDHWKILLTVGLIAYAGFYLLLPKPISLVESMSGTSHVPITFVQGVSSLLEGIAAVYLTLSLLVIGKKYLNNQSHTVRYIADSSYWIYLVHLPLLLYIQFILIDTELNMWMKLAISCGATFLIGIASYALLVRWTPIGWLLSGKRKSLLK